MELRQFISELKGRGVHRVAALYSAGAWALLQVADVIFPMLGLPQSSISAVLLMAAAGFPIAVVLAWVFDLNPTGVVVAPPANPHGPRIRMSLAHAMEFVLILLLALLVGYLYLDRLAMQERENLDADFNIVGERTSIAVMPFVNMTGTEDIEYLGDGLAEEILNLLAKLNELNVAARTSSFYFKNKNEDIREIARSLGVGHVLEGSVREHNGRVRVTAQLIEAGNGFHLWSETYDRELDDLLALQDEIAGRVVDSLQILLSSESRDAFSLREEVDPVAYDYYLRGLSYLRLPKDGANLEIAVQLFGKAVAVDPGFADAYAGLCDAFLVLYAADRDSENFQAAEGACHRALTLDRRAATVYIALGNLYRHSGQYAQSMDEFNMAISLNPTSPDAHLGLADAYLEDNQLELAKRSYEKALELQPNYWSALMSMGRYQFHTGQVEKAIPYYERVIDLKPDSDSALNNLAASHFMLGNYEEASVAWEKSLKFAPSALAYANLATSLYFQGRFDDALPLYHQAVEASPEDYEMWGNLGDAYSHGSKNTELARPMYENALKLAANRLKINANDADTLALMAHYAASIGLRGEALEYIERADPLRSENMVVQYSAATALCTLGEYERALEMLERALQLGYPRQMFLADPNLQGMREMPGFAALTALR